MSYLVNLATWTSQTINVWLLAGNPDMTVSARCYVSRHKPLWGYAFNLVDALFFWEDDHCLNSFLRDVAYAEKILRLKEENDIKG